MVKNASLLRINVEAFDMLNMRGVGISNTISMSNTMKMMAKRKNRSENGIRALWVGSNPHSNGEDFSRSLAERVANIHAKKKMMNGMAIASVEARSIIYM
jgi:hypothetical protein